MNYESGAFQCPKCKEDSFAYKKWKKRKIDFENHIINDWIFYENSEINKDYNFYNYLKRESTFKCLFELDYCNFCIILLASILIILLPVLGIVLIGLWITILYYIDCFACCCCCDESAPITKWCFEVLKYIYCCQCDFFKSINKEDCCKVLKAFFFFLLVLFLLFFIF